MQTEAIRDNLWLCANVKRLAVVTASLTADNSVIFDTMPCHGHQSSI